MDRRAKVALFERLRWTHWWGGELMIESQFSDLLHN